MKHIKYVSLAPPRWGMPQLLLGLCTVLASCQLTSSEDAALEEDLSTKAPKFSLRTITARHRTATNGAWGPHLGHLTRTTDGILHWVDDVCTDGGVGVDACNVDFNRALANYTFTGGTWNRTQDTSLSTGTVKLIQQNMGAIATDGSVYSYGVDTQGGKVVECRSTGTQAPQCAPISIATTGPSANYIGATTNAAGWKIVWWTNVVNGGGGSARYISNYGGGWNGPFIGPVGGYNSTEYGVGTLAGTQLSILFQGVTGLNPAWSYQALLGKTDLVTGLPIVVSNALPIAGNEVPANTVDYWIDPQSGDHHLLARTLQSSQLLYYVKPSDGAWLAPQALGVAFHARFIPISGGAKVALVTALTSGLTTLKIAARSQWTPGTQIPFATLPSFSVPVPSGNGPVWAIYPEHPMYQSTPVTNLNFAVVQQGAQNVIQHVSVTGY